MLPINLGDGSCVHSVLKRYPFPVRSKRTSVQIIHFVCALSVNLTLLLGRYVTTRVNVRNEGWRKQFTFSSCYSLLHQNVKRAIFIKLSICIRQFIICYSPQVVTSKVDRFKVGYLDLTQIPTKPTEKKLVTHLLLWSQS